MFTRVGKGEGLFYPKHERHQKRKGIPCKLYSGTIANKDCESKEQKKTKEGMSYF